MTHRMTEAEVQAHQQRVHSERGTWHRAIPDAEIVGDVRGKYREVLTPTRQRHTALDMLPIDAAYAAELDKRWHRGEIMGYRFLPCTIRIDQTQQYTPRFVIYDPDGAVFVEIIEKLKDLEVDKTLLWRVAARAWPAYAWLLVQKKGRGFQVVEIAGEVWESMEAGGRQDE